MTTFEKLFGVEARAIKNNCVLLPLALKGVLDFFGAEDFRRGKLYGCANTKDTTLIHTGMGATLVGDAVLHLKEAGCENLFLFGSCGSLGHLDIGSLVFPETCLSYEGFSGMLVDKPQEVLCCSPDKGLSGEFLRMDRRSRIHKVCCATTGSLKLEEEYLKIWIEKGVDVVDMEGSAFFSAAKFLKVRAVGLFYVSDIVSRKPFYETLSVDDSQKMETSIKEAAFLIKQFTKQLR